MTSLNRVPKRLKALEETLRGGDTFTVGELSARLSVSRRTLFRDLGYLRDQGSQITSEPGRGGGIRYERPSAGYSVSFSPDEIVSLWLASHLSRVATGLPWSHAAQSGLSRLFSSLPRERMRELRFLCKRVVVGDLASSRVREGATHPPTELLGIFERAFSQGLCLGFDYVDRNGARTQRRIEPHGLLVEAPVWYILAVDVDKREPRTFRMDRISRPRLLQELKFTPDIEVVRAQTEHLREGAANPAS